MGGVCWVDGVYSMATLATWATWVRKAGVEEGRQGGREVGGVGFGWVDLLGLVDGSLGDSGFGGQGCRELVASVVLLAISNVT